MKIYRYGQVPMDELLIRTVETSGVSEQVRAIIADVAARGDAALIDCARRFDGAELEALEVTREEIDRAYARTDPALIRVMETAAENIRAFHARELPQDFQIDRPDGTVLGVKVTVR